MEMQFGNSVAPNEGNSVRDRRQVQFSSILQEALGKVRAVAKEPAREVHFSAILQEAARKAEAQEPAREVQFSAILQEVARKVEAFIQEPAMQESERQVQFSAIIQEAMGKLRAVRQEPAREVRSEAVKQEPAGQVQTQVMQEPVQLQRPCKRKAIEDAATSLAVESSKRAKELEVSVVDGMMLSVMFSLCCEQGNVVRRKLHGIPRNFTFNQLKEYVENIYELQPNSHLLEWIHDTDNQ